MTVPAIRCWACDERIGAADHFCPVCHKIQPLPTGIDHFQFLDVGQRLNLDLGQLEATFHDLSRHFHPDYFFGSDLQEQQFSMDRSSFLNDSYRTLRDPVLRAKYRLGLEGVDLEEGKQKTPPELLMEVFEVNERLEEIRAVKGSKNEQKVEDIRRSLRKSQQHLEERLMQLKQELEEVFALWDQALSGDSIEKTQREQLTQRMQEIVSHRSFIQNLLEELQAEV